MIRALAAAAVLMCLLGAAPAAEAPTPWDLEKLVLLGDSPEDLRARLHAYLERSPDDAPDAFRLAARSYERSGLRDSAIAELRRATSLHAHIGNSLNLAHQLLRRRAESDIAEAFDVLAAARASNLADRDGIAQIQGLKAWALSLSGQPDSAFAATIGYTETLLRRPEWRYRLGKILVDAGRYRVALDAIRPLALEGRLQDVEVSKVLTSIGEMSRGRERISQAIENEVLARDREELPALAASGGKRVRIFAPDRFGLGCVIAVPKSDSLIPAIIVLMHPGDPFTAYDSLGLGLKRAGFAALFMDVRGAGWSVGPSCPVMETWEGREERMVATVANDVKVAWRELAQYPGVDTTRFALMGLGTAAPMASAAAAGDPRIAALVLASPRCEQVERGLVRARVAARPLPLFIQLGSEDRLDTELPDALYQASDRPVSRVTEGRGPVGAALFQNDPTLMPRITDWLAERMAAHPQGTARSSQPR